METITKIISLFVNETNQIEVIYEVDGTDADGYRVKRQEGRVWSPTDDIASDTLSGAHPDVKKLAAAYWNPAVVTTYSTDVIAAATAERLKVAAYRDALSAETAAYNEAKAAADTAKAEADAAVAASEAAKQAAADQAAADKAAYDAAHPGVPSQVTMKQARLALLGAGMLDKVQVTIDGLSEPQKTAALITWDYSSTVERTDGLMTQLAAALGLTDAQIDGLFIAASKL
jgi:hypothetical protein